MEFTSDFTYFNYLFNFNSNVTLINWFNLQENKYEGISLFQVTAAEVTIN